MKKLVFVVLLVLGGIAALGLDILFFVRGVEEVVRGFSASPHSGHDIAWGLVNILWRDVFVSAVYGLYALILTAVFWGKTIHRAARQPTFPF